MLNSPSNLIAPVNSQKLEVEMQIKFRILLLPLLIILLNSSCIIGENQKKIIPSFYYWKTTLDISEKNIDYLKEIGIKKLYIRFFDITWDKQKQIPIPCDKLIVKRGKELPFGLIPVVFITQDVLYKIRTQDINNLSKNIINEIIIYLDRFEIKDGNIDEIQIDTDWTKTTREKYFLLIKNINNYCKIKYPNIKISVTLRLHQIHNYESNIPPVKSVTLMVYQTSNPYTFKNKNSILNRETAQYYLRDIGKYPIKINIALPIFSWLVHFDEDKNFVRIINNYDRDVFVKNKNLKKIDDKIFVAKENFYFNNKKIYKNDILKIEESHFNENIKLLKFIKNKLNNDNFNLILYHFDYEDIKRITNGKTKKIIKIFDI